MSKKKRKTTRKTERRVYAVDEAGAIKAAIDEAKIRDPEIVKRLVARREE